MKNESGYTLLEMLISFSLFLMMMSFVPVVVKMTKEYQQKTVSLSTLEWDLFIQQLTFGIREGHQVTCSSQRLTFTDYYNRSITYEKYGKVIRRRVNGTGHEVVLQNVSAVQFQQVAHGIIIQIRDLENRVYAQRISVFNSDGLEHAS